MKRLDELTEDDLKQIGGFIATMDRSSFKYWDDAVSETAAKLHDPGNDYYWPNTDLSYADEIYAPTRWFAVAAYAAVYEWQQRQESEGQGR